MLEEVRRPADGELEGFIRQSGAQYEALTVFHGLIGARVTVDEARELVHQRGLSALAERWFWRSRETATWSVVVPQEVRPGAARVAVGYYAIPGVEMTLITADDLAHGDILTLEQPDSPIEGYPD